MVSAEVTRHPADPIPWGIFGQNREYGIERAQGLKPGDYILVHSHSKFAPKMIGFGQRLHHHPPFAYWTHAAVYVGDVEGWAPPGDTVVRKDMLIEAKGGQKVRYVPLSQYDVRDYAAVRFGDEVTSEMRHNAVRFAMSRLGRSYGYFTILTLSAWALFGGKFTFGMSGHDICSGLVAQTTMYEGEIYTGDAVDIMPADLAEKRNIRR